MKYTHFLSYILFVCTLGACTEHTLFTTLPGDPDREVLEKVSLNLESLPIRIIGEAWDAKPDTRVATATNPNENLISNIWVLQYSNDGTQLLTAPRYYMLNPTITTTGNISVMLRPAMNSKIYFIANTNSSSWTNGTDVSTIDKLKNKTMTFASEGEVYGGTYNNLLMCGSTEKDITAGTNNDLGAIQMKRMVAKISFKYALATEAVGKLNVSKIAIENVPNIIKIGETTTTPYPSSFTSLAYSEITSPQEGVIYTGYIPENLRGTTTNTNEKTKNEAAPAGAFIIRLYIDSEMDGSSYVYTIYPGENNFNDFNIKRNYQYNMSLKLNSTSTDSRVMAAPANCFVMKRNSKIIFDPYDRTETGGGWKYTDYVNKDMTDKSFDRVNILWQTGDGTSFAIGNNTGNNLVYLNKKDNKVYVTSGNADGNAVIAGYNAKGVIVWSWHIWVNNSAPAQIANAVKYTTYNWDSSNIYTDTRVPGYSFMSCNLGATSTSTGDIKAYGLYYQWGRKDPFPQTAKTDIETFYANAYPKVTPVYNNSAQLISMSSTIGAGELFQSKKIDASTGTITYAIQHPTIFMATAEPASFENLAEVPTHNPDLYINDGGIGGTTINYGEGYLLMKQPSTIKI